MADITARQFIISALIFFGIIAGGFALISQGLPNNGEMGGDVGYNATLNKFHDIEKNTNEMKSIMENAKLQNDPLGILNGLTKTVWGSIVIIWTSLSTLTTVFNSLSTLFGIPSWFLAIGITIITITIIYAIMSAVFRWRI